ncbi:MAG: MFS transporter [Pseudomonadota bacterium]
MSDILPRSRTVILVCGSGILMLALGTRQTFGLFLPPMTADLGWGRETFGFAIALQNLVWGLVQPFVGALADRHGAGRVLAGGGVLYAVGLAWMAHAGSGTDFTLSAGLIVGVGLACTSFGVVMAVVGRAFDERSRSLALGVVGAGGSLGQFAMLPYGQFLIAGVGWHWALLVMAASSALIVPLAAALAGRPKRDAGEPTLNFGAGLREAAGHRGFWYLTASFLVCGFQTIFVMIHLPAFVIDHGLPAVTGMMALAVIGFMNIVGSVTLGALGGHWSKKNILVLVYLSRVVALLALVALPVSAASVYFFAAVMGFTWLGTVPLTNGLVAQIFGVRQIGTLFSIAFLGHQVGSFLGAWLGGYVYDAFGSYQIVWWAAIALSLTAAALCWPIDERRVGPAPRPVGV